MQKSLLAMLRCPLCQKGGLAVEHVSTNLFIPVKTHEEEFIKEGLLNCIHCNAVFPIINSILTVLPDGMMNDEEKRFINNYDRTRKTRTIDFVPLTQEERLARMKAFLLQFEFYREESYPDEKSKAWIRNSVNYEVNSAHLKEKYISTLSWKLKKQPRAILDIGGGQGGTLYCFKQHFNPDCTVLIDLDDRFTPIAMLRDDTINVIRTDATNMPFKSKVFDLTISNGCLEHVENWPAMLAEIKRTGTETYISYIPNGSFPWEVGHLSTPLVPVLPKSLARHVCFFWHRVLNNHQYTYELIDHLLNITFFVPSRHFARECKRLKIDATNMFSFYTIEASKATYHHTYGKYVRFLGRHPVLLKFFTVMAMSLHVEPIVHYYLFHPD
jgi:uncharacterized protein YbaR (Trm112 family)